MGVAKIIAASSRTSSNDLGEGECRLGENLQEAAASCMLRYGMHLYNIALATVCLVYSMISMGLAQLFEFSGIRLTLSLASSSYS